MLWAVVVFGAATIAFGLSRNFMLSLTMLVLLGAADMISVFIRSSLVQLNTPDRMRGRVAERLRSMMSQAEGRSEEHTSELQSLMRISYAVFCLKKKKQNSQHKALHI